MEEKTIEDMMKNIKANSPLAASEKKMTNHSARKTALKKMHQAPALYAAVQQFRQHQQALRESYRPISNVQSQHLMYYSPSNIVYLPTAPIQQVINISNSVVTFNQNEAKRQRTCTSVKPTDVDAEIGFDFTLFPELLD